MTILGHTPPFRDVDRPPPWAPSPPSLHDVMLKAAQQQKGPPDTPRPRGSDLQPQTPAAVREFGTGATRDLDANKLDFEGFLSPLVLERYAEHMHKARRMPDGTMRESDNWQLGIPVGVYIKSLWRHFFGVWKLWRGLPVTEVVRGETIVKDLETELCAVIFNASGMLHETLKAKKQ